MGQKFCKFMLKTLGWKAMDPPAPEKKCVILGVPHTSIWDFAVSYFYYYSVGGTAKVMIKKEAFFWPLGPILRRLGAVPIDRKHPSKGMKDIITEMKEADEFHLAMCPEGTRKAVAKWKTGFHTIARETGASVYIGYFNWGKKEIGRGEKFEISDNAIEDLKKIQEIYETMHLVGKNPKGYRTH